MNKPPRILDLAFAVRGIPSNSKHLLVNMAKLGNSTGQCFASQETLAKMSCFSIRSVRRSQGYLREHKLVTRIPNPKGSTDRYLLNYNLWAKFSTGQSGYGKRKESPLGRGHAVRQNPNMNLKLNQGRSKVASKFPNRFSEAPMQEHISNSLSGIEKAMSEQEKREGANHG